jgi:hypothetical protein
MSFNATTLSAAIGMSDTTLQVASATGITAPNFTAGTGITYLAVEQEVMLVLGVNGTFITVQRGVAGTPVQSHAASAAVLAGLPSDFGPITPSIKAQQDYVPNALYGFSGPVASAGTITPSGPLFHVTGTTTISTINLPAGYIEGGEVTIVFDGVAAWNSAGNIAVAGTPTTAGSAVTFIYDQGTYKCYPSRLA